MIFKVYFQKKFNQVPVREFTESIYVEGDSEADVRKKLAPREYNIEFVTPISGEYLEYEQSKGSFTVESL
ncbi:DNA-dependent RNA polymerase subunit epsilon [Alkalihalobacillus deserti]|uniref:DNA-dependent RNA polymerase subunit epsilon n=1 Tax=Alkalihalobacillus deserti TaxID=2879466 RepID=UPI001D14B2D0|nr:DNA-directed RNA polymerase subunit epsilon [Alkalihalobacillus deserti]